MGKQWKLCHSQGRQTAGLAIHPSKLWLPCLENDNQVVVSEVPPWLDTMILSWCPDGGAAGVAGGVATSGAGPPGPSIGCTGFPDSYGPADPSSALHMGTLSLKFWQTHITTGTRHLLAPHPVRFQIGRWQNGGAKIGRASCRERV